MKRLVRYQLNFHSKWLTLSGVMMGFAFFLQALDYFAMGRFFEADVWDLILFLVIPMLLEALWSASLRTERWNSAAPHGIFAVLICLILLAQVILSGGVFQIIIASIFFLLASATAVLITWGFIAHRALGILVFSAVVAMQVLVFVLPGYGADPGYVSLIRLIPSVCVTLSMTFLFGGIRMDDYAQLQ